MFWPSFKLLKGLGAFKSISFSREFVPFDLIAFSVLTFQSILGKEQ